MTKLQEISKEIADKCVKYGLPAPQPGELWEDALKKVLVLIVYLELGRGRGH